MITKILIFKKTQKKIKQKVKKSEEIISRYSSLFEESFVGFDFERLKLLWKLQKDAANDGILFENEDQVQKMVEEIKRFFEMISEIK